MPETLQKFNNSSTTSTASASSSSSSSASTAAHNIIIAARNIGISMNAATLHLVNGWLLAGLSEELVIDYVLAETAMAPRPTIRYAAAIANRLIKSGIRTLDQARRPKVSQTNYGQREYEETRPGELPAWFLEMLEEEQNQQQL